MKSNLNYLYLDIYKKNIIQNRYTFQMKDKFKKIQVQEKKIIKEFTGKRITKYSGITSLMPFILVKLDLISSFNKLFPTVNSNALKFTNTQILLTIILSSLCGIFRVSKISNFTNDVLIQNLLSLKNAIDNQTLTNRIKSLGNAGSHLLTELLLSKTWLWVSKSKITSITLDVDSSVIEVYGRQEGAEVGYNATKQKVKSYHPLIAFISELKIVCNSWFRTGSAYTANGICDFVKQISIKLPNNIEEVFFRADSGFFDGKLFDLLEKLNFSYLVKVKLYSNIKKKLIDCVDWKEITDNRKFSICEIEYQGKSWKKSRILKATRVLKGYEKIIFFGKIQYKPLYDYFCYCSNLEINAYELHLNYAKRATSETWIEQVKSHLNAGKTIINDFSSNDIFWQLSVLAYNISVMARFKWKKFFKEEHNTFRDWFINVPAVLISSGRRMYLKIYKYYNHKDKWEEFDDLLLSW